MKLYKNEYPNLPDGINVGYKIWTDERAHYFNEVYTTQEEAQTELDSLPPLPGHRRRIFRIYRQQADHFLEVEVYRQEPKQ